MGCHASRRCTLGALLVAAAALGCTGPGRPTAPLVATAPPPSQTERYCAWYGDARNGVLYFGEAAFWSGYRASGGDPRADLAHEGPQLVGRFDLASETLLAPLDVGVAGARSGVWDVLAHPNGRVYFTTFFEPMGWVDPVSGATGRFPALGRGLNEIAPGPGESLLVTRYGGNDGGSGSVLRISPEGELLAELPVPPPSGSAVRTAPKTPAFDPGTREVWVTDDLLPVGAGEIARDAVVLSESGELRRRISEPEIQFVAFDARGTGDLAEVDAAGLSLRQIPAGRRLLLDRHFARALDFAQDVKPAPDGRVVVTRWSGTLHVVSPDGGVRDVTLPALEPGGLYYTGVVTGERLCATYCAGVSVVCTDLR